MGHKFLLIGIVLKGAVCHGVISSPGVYSEATSCMTSSLNRAFGCIEITRKSFPDVRHGRFTEALIVSIIRRQGCAPEQQFMVYLMSEAFQFTWPRPRAEFAASSCAFRRHASARRA